MVGLAYRTSIQAAGVTMPAVKKGCLAVGSDAAKNSPAVSSCGLVELSCFVYGACGRDGTH